MSQLKRTPLFAEYEEYGAKTVEFGGWEMPVQFTSIVQEHETVRQKVGLFDVSHMGEFEVTGPDSLAFLQSLVTNDVRRMEPGMAMYSPMVYPSGGCVDDLLLYCFSNTRFWVVVNAGNIDKDFEWFCSHEAHFDVKTTNQSQEIAQLALQGPLALQVLQSLTPLELDSIRYYHFVESTLLGASTVISRTGYTGEDGFELYLPARHAVALWRALLEAGKASGILPCGLGCRDTLRLEARLPLYGHELTEHITPLEAGLSSFVKLDKGEFVGSLSLAEQKADGVKRKVVGIVLTSRGVPRAGYPVYADGTEIGYVTSGTMSPTLKTSIGLALVDAAYSKVGTSLEVDIRGKRATAEVVKTPFYKRQH